jgi:type VI secretion system protein ImpG
VAGDAKTELLRYYREELSYLRRMGGAFAQRFPAVAARLQLGPDVVPDPHVERLIESFAFLTARIQRDLDASLPEHTTALLDVLYPNYTAPVPSLSVAQIAVDPSAAKLTSGYVIPRHTPLFATDAASDRTLRFRTGYPVTLWPIRVVGAGFESPDTFDFLDFAGDVASVLRIRLECTAGAFRDLAMKDLRFYVNGDSRVVQAVYEAVFAHARRVAVVGRDPLAPRLLPATTLVPVGFDANDALLPTGPHSHAGYGVIQEYFAFPQKFNFFDVTGLGAIDADRTLDLLILLDRPPADRIPVDRGTFVTGCTPIVNLFTKACEPIRLDHRQTEYRVIPDQRREAWAEVHTILRVSAQPDSASTPVYFRPFFSFEHGDDVMAGGGPRAFWYARTRPSIRDDVPGAETLLSLVNLDFSPTDPGGVQSVYVQALCTNRHNAEQLPTGAELQTELAAPIQSIAVLHRPTPQRDTSTGGANHWKLISQLGLNHLSIDGAQGARALREMLRLYAGENAVLLRQIAGVHAVSTRRVTRRIGADAWRGFCRGIEITVTVDENEFVGSNPYLFAAVLNRFFGGHAAVNSFTQLRVLSVQREGVWQEWPPTAGAQIVA